MKIVYITIFLFLGFTMTSCVTKSPGLERVAEGSYFSLAALDANSVWAGGHEGIIMFYDGTSWTHQGTAKYFINDFSATDRDNIWGTDYLGRIYHFEAPDWVVAFEAAERFRCISALDVGNVWAGSEDGSIYHFDGDSWGIAAELSEAVIDMDVLDSEHVWAVGGRYFASPDAAKPTGPGHICFFDGKSWSEQYESEEMLYGVSAVDESHVWVVGDGGTIYFYDGNVWTKMDSPTTCTVLAVSAADAEHVWAITGRHVLAYNGDDWAIQHEFRLREEEEGIIELSDIFALDEDNVWLAGSDGIFRLNSK